MVCHPGGHEDNCLLDIYDIFSRYWEGPGQNGDENDTHPAPLAILDGEVIDVEGDQNHGHENPETPQPSRGGIADDGYADPCPPAEVPVVTPDPPPRPTPTSVASGGRSLPSPASSAPSNEELLARLAAVRPSHSKPTCTHTNTFF